MSEYEVYREKFLVTEYKDDAVYKTQSQGYGWFDMDEVYHPPKGVIYATIGEYEGVGIRRKKTGQLRKAHDRRECTEES